MKLLFSLAMAWALSLAVNAATVSFSGITSTNSVKTNDLLLVDSALGGTNYVTRTATIATLQSALSIPTVPTGLVSNSVAQSGLLAVDSTKTNGIAATFVHVTNALGYLPATNASLGNYVLKAGDTMTGPLVITNNASANVPFTVNGLAGQTNNVFQAQAGGTNYLNVGPTGAVAANVSYNSPILDFYGAGALKKASSTLINAYDAGGTAVFGWTTYNTTGIQLNSAAPIGWCFSGTPGSGGSDLFLWHDAANTLAQRNGTNAQTFRVYNTYTDASNYEMVKLAWSGNAAHLTTVNNGTGSARELMMGVNADHWKISTSGHLLAVADNTYDIGASGNKPRFIYAASAFSGGEVFASGRIKWQSSTSMTAPTDGTMLITTDGSVLGNLRVGTVQAGYTKVLTSTTAADFLYIAVPNTNMIGGKVLYTVNATDGTDSQQITGFCMFGAVGKGTAVTANITDTQNASTVSAGTLSAVLAKNVATNNVFALGLTATTSLTTTNLTIKWRLETPSTYTVNPL